MCIRDSRRDERDGPPASGSLEGHIQEWLDQNHQGGVRDIEEPQDILPESFELYQDMEREQVANMAVFPIVCKKGELGYIVMLELRRQDSLDLVNMLLFFIAQEISRRQDAIKLEYSIYKDSLTGLDVYKRQALERLLLLTGRRGLEQEVPCRIRIWMQVRLIHSCINS